MIITGNRPKSIVKKIQYPYSLLRLKTMSKEYVSKEKSGLSELNALGMTRKNTVRFIQDIEMTFGVSISDSDLNSVNNILTLGRAIEDKIKKENK